MNGRSLVAATLAAVFSGALPQESVLAQEKAPIRIGVPTAVQSQVGRDTQEAVQMAIDDINAKGGELGRKKIAIVGENAK